MNTFSSYETQELFYADCFRRPDGLAHSKETAETKAKAAESKREVPDQKSEKEGQWEDAAK